MNILVPQGIGDSIWALHKVEDIARCEGDGVVNILIACFSETAALEARAVDFISRFSFVNSVKMYEVPRIGQAGAVLLPGWPADSDGYYRYIPDGPTDLPGVDYVLMPNAPLERGIRLEDWLPQYKTNWDIMDTFEFKSEELAIADEVVSRGEYAVFFLGSLASNTTAGHNRDGIWTPEDWLELGKEIESTLGIRIVLVGASYDELYYQKFIRDQVNWENLIGKLGIAATFAVTKRARFIISYQSGIGIVSNYFGVPTGIFWRQKGDSVLDKLYVTFEEAMSSAWVNPKIAAENKHMPLIYGRHSRHYIMDQIKERKW